MTTTALQYLLYTKVFCDAGLLYGWCQNQTINSCVSKKSPEY